MYLLRINISCCLIQNEDSWISEHRSCDGQSLTLSAAEPNSAFTDQSMHAIRKAIDKLKRIRDICGGTNIFVNGRELHPYEIPEIIQLPVFGAWPPYLEWLRASVGV